MSKNTFINIQDLLLKSLNKSGKKGQIIKSIVWNSLIDFFKENKNIDITSYIISIQIIQNILIIKTNKSILNSEILLNNKKILEYINSKTEKTLNFTINTIKYK